MKKGLAVLLAVALVLGSMSGVVFAAETVDVWDGTVDTTWYNDTDTEFTITTAEQLAGLAKLVNEGNKFAGKKITLDADIDLAGKTWTPIGTSVYDKTPASADVKVFEGSFDGNNHTITALTSDGYVPASSETRSTEYSFGLFGCIYGADISNVKLANVNINGTTRTDSDRNNVAGSGVAALIGYAYVDSGKSFTVSNCHVLNGSVSASNNMGGLIGFIDSQVSVPQNVDIRITNCSNNASVTSEAREAGGIVGLINASRTDYSPTMAGSITFKNCVNSGNVTTYDGGGVACAGGILGKDQNEYSNQQLKIIFDSCVNSGTITVYAKGETHIAGLGTSFYSPGVWLVAKNSSNTGDIVVKNPENADDLYVGGLFGYAGVMDIIDSTSTGSVDSANTYVGDVSHILFVDGMEDFADEVGGYTYFLNGGNSPEFPDLVDDVANSGGNFSVLVKSARLDGARFEGWFDNAELEGDACTALKAGVKTYYAKWSPYVAKIDDVVYTTLEAAIDAAANGDTITILKDIELSENAYTSPAGAFKFSGYYGLMIPDNKEITIDLNGKIISYKDTHGACDSSAVYNIGNLTIDDSSADKTGKIVFADVSDNVTYNQNHAVIFNVSTLTVNAGTIEHMDTGNGTVSDAIDNNSNISYNYGKDAICTINGGTLIGADYRAIRQYTHYNEGVLNRVTINGGVVKGGIYMQHGDSWYYADSASGRLNVDCKLVINGGTITTLDDGYGHIRSYLCNPDNAKFGLTINGGKIEVPVQVMVQRGAYYANGVSGTIVSSEAAGTRTAEWLAKNGGFINGGTFTELGDANDAMTNLAGFLAEDTELQRTGAGFYTVINANDSNTDDDILDALAADSISIEYKDVTATDAEGEKTYEVYVKANDDDKINELASVDLTFDFKTEAVKGGAMNITVLPTKDFTMSTAENDRYMFNYNGTTAFEGTANAIAIATIKVEGYGKFSIATKDLSATANDTNIVNATTIKDNLVDSYTAAGATDSDTTTGALIINKDTDTTDELVGGVANVEIAVPTRTLTVNIAFPNAVENNVKAYQAMSVRVAGGNYDETFALGTDGTDYNFALDLPYNAAYTVTVSGAGYRTARYTVTLNDNKTLNFWNNVMDEDKEVEVGKTSSAVKQNFLAGDIVKDNNINIYDLSAVVSYFASTSTIENGYAKYDLNRDGVIDSKDVAYVLVSWNN